MEIGPYRWTFENVLKLVELFREHRVLWDTNHVAYHNKIKRRRSLQEIAFALQTTEEEIKKKIKGLRTQYASEKGKEARSNEEKEYVSKWAHYQSLQFLDHHIIPTKPALPNVTDDDCIIKDEIDDEDLAGIADEYYDEVNQPDESPINHQTSMSNSFSEIPMDQQSTHTMSPALPISRPQIPKRSAQTSDELLVESCKFFKSGRERSYQLTEDENDTFGRHVANELRSITNPRTKSLVKMKIQQVIFEAQYGEMNFQSREGSHPSKHL